MPRHSGLVRAARLSAPVAGIVVGWILLATAAGRAQEETTPGGGSTAVLTTNAFDEPGAGAGTASGVTAGQTRLLVALGVVVGMVGLAALAAWCVTWLADRGPTGGPAPVIGGGELVIAERRSRRGAADGSPPASAGVAPSD